MAIKHQKLSNHTISILRKAGWAPGRRVNARERWIGELEEEGYQCSPEAMSILSELGGLHVKPPKHLGYIHNAIDFDPVEKTSGEFDMMEVYERKAKEPLFPLGECLCHRILFAGESGKIYVGDICEVIYFLADTIEEALEYLIAVEPPDPVEL